MVAPHQYEIALPPRPTPSARASDAQEKLREQIAELVTACNAEDNPEWRAELFRELQDKRAQLAAMEGRA
jgi:hypothetical protein